MNLIHVIDQAIKYDIILDKHVIPLSSSPHPYFLPFYYCDECEKYCVRSCNTAIPSVPPLPVGKLIHIEFDNDLLFLPENNECLKIILRKEIDILKCSVKVIEKYRKKLLEKRILWN